MTAKTDTETCSSTMTAGQCVSKCAHELLLMILLLLAMHVLTWSPAVRLITTRVAAVLVFA